MLTHMSITKHCRLLRHRRGIDQISLQTVCRTLVFPVAAMLCTAVALGQTGSAPPSDMGSARVSFRVKGSQTASKAVGVVTVGGSSVSYAEVNGKTTPTLTCADFLAGASVRKDNAGSALIIPASWGSRALWADASEGLSPEGILERIKAECATPGSSADLAFSNGVTYQIAWMEHGQGRGRLKRSDGSVSVSRFNIRFSDKTYSARDLNYSCSNVDSVNQRSTRECRDCLATSTDGYGFKSADKTVSNTAILQGLKNACALQEAGHKKELEEEARREAVRQQEEARREAIRQQEEARRRAEEAVRRVAEFRDTIRSAVRSAEESEPFSNIRSRLDPIGPGGFYWEPSLKLPGADKCALLNAPASMGSNVPVWAFACIYTSGWPSPSDFGEESMAKSVEAALGVPYRTDEGAKIKQVVFSDPAKPNWRLYVARTDASTVGVSIVAAQISALRSTAATVQWFAPAMMLVSHPTCQEYKKREDDRTRRVEDVKTLSSDLNLLSSELNLLVMQYQNAIAQANQAAQSANISCPAASNSGLGVINAMGCIAARTNYETNRLQAQSLGSQITQKQSQSAQKQSQMISAQTSLVTLPPSVLPTGCRTDGTAIIAVPSSAKPTTSVSAPGYATAAGSSSVVSNVSAEPTVHDVVDKIRSGDHGPMPVAQRSGGAGVPGRTTMTIRNSTAYELSVFFDGPVSTKITLRPGAVQDVDLAPGLFHVAGRVSASDVLPFYGEETYEASARYSVRFYIGQ